MPQAHHIDPADDLGRDSSTQDGAKRCVVRDRHSRREPTTANLRTGPRKTTGPQWTIGPPKVVPMTEDEHNQAIQAWAVLIAAWWTKHPEELDDTTDT